MTDRELDIAMTAAVMGSECFELVKYKLNGGYIDTINQIGYYAIEFVDQYEDVDWEVVLSNPETYEFSKHVCCWDDAIIEFVGKQLNLIK